MLLASTSAQATNIDIAATQIPNFNPSNIGGNMVVTGVTIGGTTMTCSACFRPAWVGLGGFTVSISGIQGPQDYTVSYIENTSMATLTAAPVSSGTGFSVTFYPYVEFRIYANQAFQPLGESYIVQPGTPGSGAWYKRYAASIVPMGGMKTLFLSAIDIDATTNSPGPTNQARYTSAFYRPDNSLIQFYNCFEQFAVPPITPTSWTALCAYNSPGGIVPPTTEAYTKPQIDARFPVCSTSQMIYYAATGNIQSCLTIGTGLSLQGNVLISTAQGGITGNGTAGYIPKFTSSSVLGNSIAREVDGQFRVQGQLVTAYTSTVISDQYGSNLNFIFNPGSQTSTDTQSGLSVSSIVQSGINMNVNGIRSFFQDTLSGNSTGVGITSDVNVLTTGSGGVKSYTGVQTSYNNLMTGTGSSSFVGFRVSQPGRGTLPITSYIGFLNTAPTSLANVQSYSALESDGGKFVFGKSFSSDEIALKNGMPLRFYPTTTQNPAQNAWVGFGIAASPTVNYTYNWPTEDVMVNKHLTVDSILDGNVSLKWAAAMEAAGGNYSIQYNNNGMLAGDTRFTINPTNFTVNLRGGINFQQSIGATTPVTLRNGKQLVFENIAGDGSFTFAYGSGPTGNMTYYWPDTPPTIGQVLQAAEDPNTGAVPLQWATTGSGSVTSIGMTVPSTLLAVSPAAITDNGTFAVTLATQGANTIFAGASSGAAAAPTFRSMVTADLPVIGTGATIASPTMTLGSDATGDTYYRKSSGALTKLGIGSTGQVLTVSAGLPSWQALPTSVTLNATNNTIPVRSGSTTLADSPLRVASGNVELYPTTAGPGMLTFYTDTAGTLKRLQIGTKFGDTTYAAIYAGGVTPNANNHTFLADGSTSTELNAPGLSSILYLNAGDSTVGNGGVYIGAGRTTVMIVEKTGASIIPIASNTPALSVDATCQTGCSADNPAIRATRGTTQTSGVVVHSDFQVYALGSTAASFGGRIRLGAKAGTTQNINAAAIDWAFTSVATNQPVSNLAFSLVNQSTSYVEYARLTPTSLVLRNGATGDTIRAMLTGGSDYAWPHPGTGTGLILPRKNIIAADGFAQGSGIWWTSTNETAGYGSLSGLWVKDGMNWQGEGGSGNWMFRIPTDSATLGASVIEINPSSGDSFIALKPYNTGSTQTTSVKFFELAANGTNSVSLKAPDSLGDDVAYQLPSKPTEANMVLSGSSGAFASPMSWSATVGSGNVVRATSPTITTPSISGMLQLHTALWVNRPTATAGGAWYCTDCAVTSASDNTCTSGGSGALAIGIGSTAVWRCFATQN